MIILLLVLIVNRLIIINNIISIKVKKILQFTRSEKCKIVTFTLILYYWKQNDINKWIFCDEYKINLVFFLLKTIFKYFKLFVYIILYKIKIFFI